MSGPASSMCLNFAQEELCSEQEMAMQLLLIAHHMISS